MGFFDFNKSGSTVSRSGAHHHSSSSTHRKHHHHKSRSRSRSRTRHHAHSGTGTASILGGLVGASGGESHSHHHHRPSHGGSEHRRSSGFFNFTNASTRTFFGTSKPSYYKRSPRPTFVTRAYKKLKRLLRDLVYYAKHHPVKVFMLVIMPLLTGGALTALLARFGLRMPAGLERMMGMGAKAMSGDSIGLVGEAVRMAGAAGLGGSRNGSGSVHLERGRTGNLQWERRSVDRHSDGWGSGGGSGLGAISGGLGSVAKMFM